MSNYWLVETLLALGAQLVAHQYWMIARARNQSPPLPVSAGLLFLALAAAAGAYRYGIDPETTRVHRSLSRLSSTTSFLLIGLGLAWARFVPLFGRGGRVAGYLAIALVICVAYGVAATGAVSPGAVATLGAGLGLLLWLGVALLELAAARALPRLQALLLAAGAVLVLLAGLVVGTEATRVFGLARMNWFHIFLALGAFTVLSARLLFAPDEERHE